jgi:ABC-type transport system involved in multi-copper enzyme maturation permease subunit
MKLLTTAKYTFIEVYRSKIFIGLIFIALSVLIISYVASEFAYGAPDKIALDFGLGIMSLSNLAVSIFLGVTLLSKEIETKTLYMILSRPISRTSFIVGKMLGLSSVILLNTLFVTFISTFLYTSLGGGFAPLILWSALFTFFEALIILSVAVMFSLITTTSMSVIFTMSYLVAGHVLSETLNNFFAKASVTFSIILKIFSYIVCDLGRLNIKDFIIYKTNLPSSYLAGNLLYALVYLTLMIFLISYIFNQKNLD